MTNLIFAFMQAYGGDERESILLARSLRTFGGELANHPLWLMMPENLEQVSETTLQALGELGVQVHRFEVLEEALKFPFGGKVYAAAAAESLASDQADILVWMDSDTVFAGEPAEFLLGEKVNFGYRPVMLKNISSLYADPVDAFWSFIFEGCGTPVEKIPPMITTVDAVRIRPQYNAGIMCLRPQKELLRTWRDNFGKLYQKSELAPYYEKHILYRIFVHQSILSATLLAMLGEDEMQDLGSRINFPMFLDIPPEPARKAVTLRYDEFKFFEQPGWEEKVDLDKSFQGWLQTQVRK
jgi:hypothetical protein